MIGAIGGVGSVYRLGAIAGASAVSRARSPYSSTASGARPEQTQSARQAGGVWTGHKAAQPEVPVQPVRPVTPASSQAADPAGLGLPIREGADPVEMAVRMRIQYVDDPAAKGEAAQGIEGAQQAAEEGRCETCEERKYQDGSDDMGVSYQTPTRIDPDQAASAVRGHEMEHVYREQAKADREGRKVVSQNVTMHTEICPECGKSFVSGGTTHTVTKADTDNAAQQQDLARQNQENQKRTPFSAVA